MAEQLSSLSMELRPPVSFEKPRNPSMLGPYLQGALMEKVDPTYAALLHQLPFNPYSQYCTWEGDSLVWRVSALSREAAADIIEPLRSVDVLELRGIHTYFDVVKTSLETTGVASLVGMINEPGPDKVRIQFVTPTAFKSKGEYVNMPSVRLMIQNLLMHYGQVYDNNKEGYEETTQYVDQHVRILAYSLRSCSFGNLADGGKRIPAFVGNMTIGLRGHQMTAGLVRMLLRFGEYSGVGIKTSMGMGGLRCLGA